MKGVKDVFPFLFFPFFSSSSEGTESQGNPSSLFFFPLVDTLSNRKGRVGFFFLPPFFPPLFPGLAGTDSLLLSGNCRDGALFLFCSAS